MIILSMKLEKLIQNVAKTKQLVVKAKYIDWVQLKHVKIAFSDILVAATAHKLCLESKADKI